MNNTNTSIKRDGDSVFFRVVGTKEIAAIAKHKKLYVFAKPLKEFRALPLDTQVVLLSSIETTSGVMRCVKCKTWVIDSNVRKCPCKGYLVPRKRFHVRGETTESLDAEYLEVQTALEDIRVSSRMERSKTGSKIPVVTGILTSKMAGMSSVETTPTSSHAGFLTVVDVKSDNGVVLDENEKYSFLEKMGADVTAIQNEEINELVKADKAGTEVLSGSLIDEWQHPTPTVVEFVKTRKRKASRTTTPKQKRQNGYNSSVPSQKKMAKCSKCGSKTPSLVENKCTKCFLEMSN